MWWLSELLKEKKRVEDVSREWIANSTLTWQRNAWKFQKELLNIPSGHKQKQEKHFDHPSGLWIATHSLRAWIKQDQVTDYGFCALWAQCTNGTCGNTYHSLFIWGISLPAFVTTLLAGETSAAAMDEIRGFHIHEYGCVCVCLSELNIFHTCKTD